MRDGLPVFDPACTTVERLEAGRSRWWTFAGVRANWLLANAVRQRGSSIRIDDFYIEMKGAIAVAGMRELLQTLNLDGPSKTLMSSKAIDVKFRDAVPENCWLALSTVVRLTESRRSECRRNLLVSRATNDYRSETAGPPSSGRALAGAGFQVMGMSRRNLTEMK